jgi:hypothetical protein
MKTKWPLLALIGSAFFITTVLSRAQSLFPEGPLRWDRYSYEIASLYPYLKELPEWSKIPTLLEWISKDSHDAGTEVAYSQLVALSRADFGHPKRPPAGGLPVETVDYYKTQRNDAWLRWWKSVGKSYEDGLRARGRQNPEAWKLVTRDGSQTLPAYKVTIPEGWVLKSTYRAGDYSGVQTESLTLRRSKERATLIRALRKRTEGQLEWEQWQPLTLEQADDFAFAVAYAIDNPWLLQSKRSAGLVQSLEGRNLTVYYPSFRYELADQDGNIWWNDDPRHWRGAKNMEGNFMNAAGNLGSVCLLLWRTFPDALATNAMVSNAGAWRPVKMPNATVLDQLAEDLALRGEIIDALWHSQRISDGLEALTEFGTPQQITAISRLETELPTRIKKVASILAQDPNGAHPKRLMEQLLAAAAKAKAAIQSRSTSQK